MDEVEPVVTEGESPPDPKPRKRTPMVTVINTHKFRKFFLKNGAIPPGCTARIPAPMYEKLSVTCPWIKRAERGDVIK